MYAYYKLYSISIIDDMHFFIVNKDKSKAVLRRRYGFFFAYGGSMVLRYGNGSV